MGRVSEASESLSTQLERATREHNLKVEQLESTFAARQEELSGTLQELEQQRDMLRDEINTLTDLQDDAQEVGQLREEIERRTKESRHEHAQMEEQVAAAEFEKTKRISEAKRRRSSNWHDWMPNIRKTCFSGTGRRPSRSWSHWR